LWYAIAPVISTDKRGTLFYYVLALFLYKSITDSGTGGDTAAGGIHIYTSVIKKKNLSLHESIGAGRFQFPGNRHGKKNLNL
jgi:hypothetical protein